MPAGKWCADDDHIGYELQATFNDWLDSGDDDAIDLLRSLGIGRIGAPSKAFYAGDPIAYREELGRYRTKRLESALGQGRFDDHWVGKNRSHFNALLVPLKAQTLIPFVGAGISCASDMPSWTGHLLHQAISAGLEIDVVKRRLAAGEHEAVINEIIALRGAGLFKQEMRDAFDRDVLHLDLATMVTDLTKGVIATTNFDRVLEQALTNKGQSFPDIVHGTGDNAPLIRAMSNRARALLKIHGDVRSPDTYILSGQQYDAGYGIDIPDMRLPLPFKLRRIYQTTSLLFVGCSLIADRTLKVFRYAIDEAGPDNVPRHFALTEAPENEADLPARNAFLADLNIDAIFYPFGSHAQVSVLVGELVESLRLGIS